MRSRTEAMLTQRLRYLALIVLAGGSVACSVSMAIAWGDEDRPNDEVNADEISHMATQIASNEAMISYLATRVPRDPCWEGVQDPTLTPYLEMQGAVVIEEGRCCVGGSAGDTIQVEVAFGASSPFAPVTEMRVRVGGMPFSEREMAYAPWEPFRAQGSYPVLVAINWVGFYVSVQYRDAQGNVSPVFFDDISVEGMPPTPTVSPQ